MVAKKDIKPFQVVFKIEGHNRARNPHSPRPFISRKAHTKSRGGCQACKKRRIKCDEALPACSRCVRLELRCSYSNSATSPRTSSTSPGTPINSATPHLGSEMYSMAVQLAQTDLQSLLYPSAEHSPIRTAYVSDIRILQHFQSYVSTTLGCPRTSQVMQSCVASSGWDHPYLMHMVLAISCAHQRHVGHSASLLAEATHWENGLQLHRENLSTLKPGQGISQWDALVATTFLSIMYTFSMHDEVLDETAISNEHDLEHFFPPLETTGGFRSLFHLFPRDHNSQSSWMPILYGTDDSAGTFTSEASGVEGLPEPFVKLCEMDETSTSHNNPYHKIVRGLAPLLCMKPSSNNFATLFAFLGRTWPSLKPLVYDRDPRGLLLLSYWLALLQQVDQWWLTKKARATCGAIVASLSRLRDPKIDELMAFPTAFKNGNVDDMWYQLNLVSS